MIGDHACTSYFLTSRRLANFTRTFATKSILIIAQSYQQPDVVSADRG